MGRINEQAILGGYWSPRNPHYGADRYRSYRNGGGDVRCEMGRGRIFRVFVRADFRPDEP